MKIAGYVKNSMTDYPGMIVNTIFLPFCNLRCSYCQNFSILESEILNFIEEVEILKDFKKKNYTDGICISGGEPSLHKKELMEFIKEFRCKFPDKKIKIDTNGTDPDFIEDISEFVDFVSIDFKTLFFNRIKKYCEMDLGIFLKSLEKLKKCKNYNIRITMYPEYIPDDEFEVIADILKGVKSIVIQQYENRVTLCGKKEKYKEEKIREFENILKKTVENVKVIL